MSDHSIRARKPADPAASAPPIGRDADVLAAFLEDAAHFPGGHASGIATPASESEVSALVRTGRWSDSYMRALERMGELATPMTRDELCERVTGAWGAVESVSTEGNMCYLVVRR